MEAPRPAALRPASRSGLLASLDRRLTVLASCSFLVHFGALGSLYGDWTDPVLDERVRLATLVEELRTLPAPPLPPVEERVRVDEGVSSPDAPDDRRARGTGREGPAPGPQGGKLPTRAGPDGRFGERPSARLSAELAALDGRLAPALNGPGHSIDSVLQRAEIPLRLLEEIGRPASAGEAGRAGDLSAGGTPGLVLRPGRATAALPGERMAWNDQASSGASAEVKRPGGNTLPGAAPTNFICILPAPPLRSTPGGDLHACYRRALEDDPTQQGSLRVIVTVGAGGEVVSAKAGAVLGHLSPGLIACVLAQIRARSRFAPDSPEGAVAVMPVSFIGPASGDPVAAPRPAAHSLRR